MTNQQSRGLVVNYDDELRIRPTNEKLLESRGPGVRRDVQARPGGGVRARTSGRRRGPMPLWPYLVMAAALIFLADVALRRIDFDLLLGRQKPPMKMVMGKR